MANASVESVEKELLGLEKRYWQAMKERDVDTAIGLTDFPCIVAGPQGVRSVDKEAFTRMFESGDHRIRSVEIGDDPQVRLLSDDVAIVAYTIHEELTVNGKPVTLDAADSSTWIRRNGGWVCALHSESVVEKPFGQSTA